MVIHVENFLKFWKYTIADLNAICCWKCNSNQQVQLAHIEQKGPGGRDWVEFIENYMPLCAKCHHISEGNTLMKGILWGILISRILKYKVDHEWSSGFKRTWFYRSEVNNVPRENLML